MTLGGLAAAVGLVIDDKIVVVENIVLHRDIGEGPLQATASALKELTVPLIGSTLTPIVVFLPLITITGVTGTFFRVLAVTMSVALLTSLVLALLWTSNLSTFLVRRGKPKPARQALAGTSGQTRLRQLMDVEEKSLSSGWFGRILKFYERWIRRAAEHPGFLCELKVPGPGPSSRDGRGRICARLRYAPPDSSLTETAPTWRRWTARFRRSTAHRRAPASNWGWLTWGRALQRSRRP